MEDRVTILHLSDLHFGAQSRFAELDPVDLAERFAKAVQTQQELHDRAAPVSMIVVTGDVVETGVPREYAQAKQFFDGLVSHLLVDRRRVVFAPGNHDVSWLECKRAELDFEENEAGANLRAMIDARKLEPFIQFVRDVRGVGRNDEFGTMLVRGALAFDYDDLGVSIVALNSCEIESHRPGDHKGLLTQEQIQSAMDHWLGATNGFLRIAAVHHNPVATVPEVVRDWVGFLKRQSAEGHLESGIFERFAADAVGLDGREYLEALAEDCSLQVVLHGHHHAGNAQPISWKQGKKGQTHVLSAGSWGLAPEKLPKNQPNALQLVMLDRKKLELHARRLVYEPRVRPEGKVFPGSFVNDPASPKGYLQDLSAPPAARAEAASTGSKAISLRPEPQRWSLPITRRSITHKFSVSGFESYITVGLFDDGQPGEIFITLGKAGSTLAGFADAWATMVSFALQHGVSLQFLVDKLTHTRFEPSGFTGNPEIPTAKSIVDYVMRWISIEFGDRH